MNSSYVFSLWVKSSETGQIAIGNKIVETTTSWEKVKIVFNAAEKNLTPRIAAGEYWIYQIQLETGNIETDWAPSNKDIQENVNIANTNASTALDNSAVAIATADGKNTAYYMASMPSGNSYKLNDIWYNTSSGYKMSYWNGTAWVETQFGESALATDAVTSGKIAAGAVTTAKLYALSVTTEKIAVGAVNADKIAANAITAVKIAAGAVETDKLAANAVTAAKIAAGTITATQIAGTTITGDKIVASTITGNKIAAKTITANNMVANTITAASGIIADAAITNAKIANLDASKITSGYISADRIKAGSITAASGIIADAAITNAKIANLDASKITSGYISADRIKAGSITADKITVTDLQAIGATIGGFTIRQDSLIMGGTYLADDASHFLQADCIYIGKNGISYNNTFCIRSDGSLLSQNPSVSTAKCMINSGSINFGISGAINMSYVNPESGYNTPQITSVLYFGVENTGKGPITVSNLVNGKVNIVAHGGMDGYINMNASSTVGIRAPYINLDSDDISINDKTVIRGKVDGWLRINDLGDYTYGTYFGNKPIYTGGSCRADGGLYGKNNTQVPILKVGTGAISGATDSNWTSKTIYFGYTFPAVPKVFFSQTSGVSVENMYVSSITNTSFNINLFGCNGYTDMFDWLAVCYY